MIDNKNWGVLYFLTVQDKDTVDRVVKIHGELLAKSVQSLKKHMPDVGSILFTDVKEVDWTSKGFDVVAHKNNTSGDVWTYKYECMLMTPFERTVHMDCDTYVCQPFYEVFEMLDNIDFAIPFSPWYFGKRQYHVPRSFPEPAGGFIAYNTNKRTFQMLEEAKELVENRGGGCDEPYLRVAMYESKLRFSILPWEYNCVFMLPGFVMDKVKVLHGKYKDIEKVERCFMKEGFKIFTGEKVVHCDKISRKKYEMGLVEICGHNKTRKKK